MLSCPRRRVDERHARSPKDEDRGVGGAVAARARDHSPPVVVLTRYAEDAPDGLEEEIARVERGGSLIVIVEKLGHRRACPTP